MPNTNILGRGRYIGPTKCYFSDNVIWYVPHIDETKRNYHLIEMSSKKLERLKRRAGITFKNNICYCDTVGRFSTEEIVKFPLYMRRGNEYGHEGCVNCGRLR